MIYISELSINLQKWYKPVKVMINTLNLMEVILNHSFLGFINTNSGSFAIFSKLVIAILFFMHQMQLFYCIVSAKLAALLKSQIIANRVYLWTSINFKLEWQVSFSISKSTYYIAKNTSTLYKPLVKLLLLLTCFQVKNAINSTLSIKRFQKIYIFHMLLPE